MYYLNSNHACKSYEALHKTLKKPLNTFKSGFSTPSAMLLHLHFAYPATTYSDGFRSFTASTNPIHLTYNVRLQCLSLPLTPQLTQAVSVLNRSLLLWKLRALYQKILIKEFNSTSKQSITLGPSQELLNRLQATMFSFL